MPYVFYDTETTGTETAFDQILQFAAIKTDDDLNELDRFNIRCRLLPHVVPSPGALRATRVTPRMLLDPALPSHYEAIRQIRSKLIEWSPATFIGYNSIQFDEDLLRQAFYQTLHPTYLTNTNGSCRGDVLRMAHAASVYSPNSMTIPIDEKGRPTFRLDQLAPANGYSHEDAHEAMADVLATIHIARRVRDMAQCVWEAMMYTTRKNAVIEIVSKEPMLAMTERYGSRMHSWVVTHCGSNPNYDGQLGVFDLNHDPDRYRSLSVDQLVSVLNASPKVIRSIRANAQPILMPFDMLPDVKKVLQITLEEAKRRMQVIRGDKDFQERVGQALSLRYADEEQSPHVEQRIYDGFPEKSDEQLMRRFHEAEWEERVAIARQLADGRLREFAHRLIYFERQDLLSSAMLGKFKRWQVERLLTEDEDVPWMTIPKALREADELLADASDEDGSLLHEVKRFLISTADHLRTS